MRSQNLDKLSQDARNMVAYLFTTPTGWTATYMIEVKLDDPIGHLWSGDDCIGHGGNGSKCYAKHWGDPEWAVIHIEDEDWLANPGDPDAGYQFALDLGEQLKQK